MGALIWGHWWCLLRKVQKIELKSGQKHKVKNHIKKHRDIDYRGSENKKMSGNEQNAIDLESATHNTPIGVIGTINGRRLGLKASNGRTKKYSPKYCLESDINTTGESDVSVKENMSAIEKRQWAKVMKEIKTGEKKKYWTKLRKNIYKTNRKSSTYNNGKWRENWCLDEVLFSVGYGQIYDYLGLQGYWLTGWCNLLNDKPKMYRRFYRLQRPTNGRDYNRFINMMVSVKYDKIGWAMDGLMSATPLCEDVIGEIVSFL